MEKDKERFEVGYDKDNYKEKTITEWKGKTIKKATVIHKGGDGYLKIEFTCGVIKKYGYNELGFWETE